MKRLSIAFVIAACLLSFSSLQAQDVKKKAKDEKVKMKKDDSKTKMDQPIQASNVQTVNDMPPENNMSMSANTGMGELPYAAQYSSRFEMANAANSKMILELWKDWDDNTFSKHADYFADTVTMIFTSGQVVKGKDNVIAGATQFRSSLANVKSQVDAWISTKSIDKNENWVCIWGSETDTDKNGKETVMRIHEIWRINKDGKVDFMQQYTGEMPKM